MSKFSDEINKIINAEGFALNPISRQIRIQASEYGNLWKDNEAITSNRNKNCQHFNSVHRQPNIY